LDRLDELNYVVEELIASQNYPNIVGAYWKGTLTQSNFCPHGAKQEEDQLQRNKHISNSKWKND
jgi:hypothetical protein